MRETKFWTWHLITGVIILFFLGLHMIITHLDLIFGFFNPAGERAIDWENVLFRSKHFLFIFVYIGLLGSALYHGLYGLRTILFELNPGVTLQKIIHRVFIFTGISLFILGTWAAFQVRSL